MTPIAAYKKALRDGPSDDTRTAACADPDWASQYAIHVDKAPRDDTRAAACADPMSANQYARNVDHYPHPTLVAKWGSNIGKNPADYMKEPTISETLLDRLV